MPLLIFIFKFVQHLILKERNHQHKQEHDYTDRRTEAQICLRVQTASKGVTVKYHAGKIQAAAHASVQTAQNIRKVVLIIMMEAQEGRDSGRRILVKRCHSVQPSTRQASMISWGISMKFA